MDDLTLKNLCVDFENALCLSSPIRGLNLETPEQEPGQFEETIDLVNVSGISHDSQEAHSCQDQMPPLFQKIEDLSEKVKIIRKEYTLLCDEVKGMTTDSLLGSEACNILQNLGKEHELLKTKYQEDQELLRKKYFEECLHRKKLYNEVIELKGNIRVFCRCRPLKDDEIANGASSMVDFNSFQDNELQIICSDNSRKQFKFDHVFKPEDSQEAVFAQTLPLVTSVLDGYNVCIFAYGQTGTGKTYTMEGTPENRGVNYRTLEELFRISCERSSIMKYDLCMSMLEVYNEKIRDLLVDNSNEHAKKLEIKQSAEGTQEVPGLVEAPVHDIEEVWDLLRLGSQVRSVGSTNANELSSRSHCLLRVTVVGVNTVNGQKTRSHLWLVDLAGSERLGRIEVEGDRLKESQFINKSLSALGDVISALASKTSHIPYRNSKLTHLLQSSLGGDCKTLMFVQVSPSSTDLGETLCSLNFASRVRGVEHGPARRQTDHTELLKYKQLAEKAKNDEKETKKLQDSLQSLQRQLAAREHICQSLREKVRDLENQLAEERKTRLKQESRALTTTISTQSSSSLSALAAEKKPPLGPSRLRPPLKRISNIMPVRCVVPANRRMTSFLPVLHEEKENNNSSTAEPNNNNSKPAMRPRRGSIAIRPPQATSNKVLQPRRRASIATLRPDSSNSNITAPLHSSIARSNSNITVPLHSSVVRSRSDRVVGRQSFVWDPQRMWRTSRISSPSPQFRAETSSISNVEAATPMGRQSSSKFKGSPPSVAGSWRPKHPTVIALQKKQLVWSPLKFKGMKRNRKSMVS